MIAEPSRWYTGPNRAGTTILDADSNEITAGVIFDNATLKRFFAGCEEAQAPPAATT